MRPIYRRFLTLGKAVMNPAHSKRWRAIFFRHSACVIRHVRCLYTDAINLRERSQKRQKPLNHFLIESLDLFFEQPRNAVLGHIH